MIEIRREQNIREKDKKSKEKRPENNHITESTVSKGKCEEQTEKRREQSPVSDQSPRSNKC